MTARRIASRSRSSQPAVLPCLRSTPCCKHLIATPIRFAADARIHDDDVIQGDDSDAAAARLDRSRRAIKLRPRTPRRCSRPNRSGSPRSRGTAAQSGSSSDDAIATLEYMDLIEGHVCAGYLHLALASPTVRATTEIDRLRRRMGHPGELARHRAAPLPRRVPRDQRVDACAACRTNDARSSRSPTGRPSVAGTAGSIAPELYPAVYACSGTATK